MDMKNSLAFQAVGMALKRPDSKPQLQLAKQKRILVMPLLEGGKNANALVFAVSRDCTRKKDNTRLRKLEDAKDRIEAMGGVVGLVENGRTRAYGTVLIEAKGKSGDLDLVSQLPGIGQRTIEVKFCEREVDTEDGSTQKVRYYELSLNPNSPLNNLASAPENIAMLASGAEMIAEQEPEYTREKQERQKRIERLISGVIEPHLHAVPDVPEQDDASKRSTVVDFERLNAFGGQRRKTPKEMLGVA